MNAFLKYKGWHLLGCVALLVLIVVVGLHPPAARADHGFLLSMLMMLGLLAVSGHAVTGLWRGFLVDSRNQISLSRLQMVGWTIIVLSGFLSCVLRNMGSDDSGGEGASSINVDIPAAVWMLLGIGTTSVVVAPALARGKATKVSPGAKEACARASAAPATGQSLAAGEPTARASDAIERIIAIRPGIDMKAMTTSVVLAKRLPSDAEWRDLILGEEVGNGSHLDIAKIQMLLFTVIVWVAYGGSLHAMFQAETSAIASLPDVPSGLVTLIGISHTGYLADKASVHTADARPSGEEMGHA